MKRFVAPLSALLGLVLAIVPLSAGVGAGAVAQPYCGITWGSLDREGHGVGGANLVNVRAGRHACYDRLVFDVRGGPASYFVRYVPEVTADPSDQLVPLRGGAFLQIVLRVPDYDLDGQPTYEPPKPTELVNVAGYRTFRQVAQAGSFEGQTTIGVGVRAKLPFRVLVLDGPDGNGRVILDVAHKW